MGSSIAALAVLLKEDNIPNRLVTEDDANDIKIKARMGISQYPELEKYKALLKVLSYSD